MIHLPNSTYVELYSEMAAAILLDQYSSPADAYVTEENGDTRYTDDAQEQFEGYCALVEGILETVGIGQEPEAAPAMTMRDQIAGILRGGQLQHIEEDVMADAIIEALPDYDQQKARIKELEAVLQTIAKRDGRASDHISCHECSDSSNESLAILKGDQDGR
jgi:hypothetical protein